MRWGLLASMGIALCGMTACSRMTHVHSQIVDETYVHKYGVVVPAEDWDARGRDGQVIIRLNDGTIVTKSYVAGILDGDTTCTFPYSDSVQKVDSYTQGVLTKEVTFSVAGLPVQEVRYPSKERREVTSWFEDGSPQHKEVYSSNGALLSSEYYAADGSKVSGVANGQGERIVRDNYGQIVARDAIEGGALVQRSTFHPNGDPKEVSPYYNGKVEGLRKTFHPDGEPCTVETWAGGKQHGTTVLFQNGEKYAEVPYINGVRHGVELRYRNGDTVVEEITWRDNLRHGPSYSHFGDTIQEQWYYKGQPVSKQNFDKFVGIISG